MTLREAVIDLRTKYKMKITVAVPRFLEAKLPDPSEKKITVPRSDKKTLRDHLERMLKPLDMTLDVEGQVVLLVPANKK